MLEIIGIISLILSLAGAGTQYEAQRKATSINRRAAELNAEAARKQTADRLLQQKRDERMRLGAIRANVGAMGGTLEGSALDILGDVAAQSEFERSQIQYAGQLRAQGYDNTAALDAAAGSAARAGLYTQAGSSLLTAGRAYYGGQGRIRDGNVRDTTVVEGA